MFLGRKADSKFFKKNKNSTKNRREKIILRTQKTKDQNGEIINQPKKRPKGIKKDQLAQRNHSKTKKTKTIQSSLLFYNRNK